MWSVLEWFVLPLPAQQAIHKDKPCDDHDDEPPCWTALAGNAIVIMKAPMDTVSE